MIFFKPNKEKLEAQVADLETRQKYLIDIVVEGIDSDDVILRQLAEDSKPYLRTATKELSKKRAKLFSLQGCLETCSPDNNKAKKPGSARGIEGFINYAKGLLNPQRLYSQTKRFKY